MTERGPIFDAAREAYEAAQGRLLALTETPDLRGHQVIPETAVEAAAERDYGPGWASASEWERLAYLAHATNLLEAAAPHMLAEVTTLVAALTDPEDCHFDHHGGCQAHGYLDLKIGEMCPQLEAKAWAFNHRPTSAG